MTLGALTPWDGLPGDRNREQLPVVTCGFPLLLHLLPVPRHPSSPSAALHPALLQSPSPSPPRKNLKLMTKRAVDGLFKPLQFRRRVSSLCSPEMICSWWSRHQFFLPLLGPFVTPSPDTFFGWLCFQVSDCSN